MLREALCGENFQKFWLPRDPQAFSAHVGIFRFSSNISKFLQTFGNFEMFDENLNIPKCAGNGCGSRDDGDI